MEDGPRVAKLRMAFKKMVEKIFEELEIDSLDVKEELFSAFNQLLLKYSIPAKLNELDERISKYAQKTREKQFTNSPEEVLLSYIQEASSNLSNRVQQEEGRVKREADTIRQEEAEIDKEIQKHAENIRNWINKSGLIISAIKQKTQ